MDNTKEDAYSIDLSNISCNISASTSMNYGTDVSNISISDLTFSGSNIAPYILTSNGTGSVDWANLDVSNNLWHNDRAGKITLQGEKADIEINGESLMEMIRGINERLNILTPNKQLEAEWGQLRELGEQYRALEKKLTEQSKMWNTLKKMPPPEIE